MDLGRKLTFCWRWSIFTAMIIATFWSIWYIIVGSVPTTTQIQWSPIETIKLPFAISRFWDILIGPILSTIVIFVVTSQKLKKCSDENKEVLVLGLVFGLVSGLAFVLVFGLAPMLIFGLTFMLIFGLASMLVSVLVFGLVSGLVSGLISMLVSVLVSVLVFGLVSGLVSALVFGLVSGLVFGSCLMIRYLFFGWCWQNFRDWLLVR